MGTTFRHHTIASTRAVTGVQLVAIEMPLTAEQKRKRRADAATVRKAQAAAFREQLPTPPTAVPDDLLSWAAANPPPRRSAFSSAALFDAAREPWYATFM